MAPTLVLRATVHALSGEDGRSITSTDPGPEHDNDFNSFFRAEYRKIVKVVMYAGATIEQAENAVSLAMTDAWARWPQLTKPNAWVRTAALHNYLKEVERNKRRVHNEMTAAHHDGLDRVPTTSREPDGCSWMIATMRRLPDVQRVVIALTIEGYEPTEIAELLNRRVTTVRSNLRHARRRLQAQLRNDRTET